MYGRLCALIRSEKKMQIPSEIQSIYNFLVEIFRTLVSKL